MISQTSRVIFHQEGWPGREKCFDGFDNQSAGSFALNTAVSGTARAMCSDNLIEVMRRIAMAITAPCNRPHLLGHLPIVTKSISPTYVCDQSCDIDSCRSEAKPSYCSRLAPTRRFAHLASARLHPLLARSAQNYVVLFIDQFRSRPHPRQLCR